MVGQKLAHYEIVDRIGAGGMGEVYLARDTKLGRDVAIKMVPPSMAKDPVRLERFEREARALASLNHPNIVTIHSVESAGGVHFLTMELLEGKTLSKAITRGGLPLGRFFDLAVPLADALAAAHAKGITHRDLKPANIMVDERGRLKVLDFGLAKLRDEDVGGGDSGLSALPTKTSTEPLTGEGRVVGTAAYMSPEQAEGKPIDHRSDIFSLGVVLYEMATGVFPFRGDTPVSMVSSILRDTPSSITEINRELPRDLGRIVMRCLAKDPARRFQTALDVRNELEELEREIDTGELALGQAAAPGRGRWTRGRVLGAAGLIVLLAAAAWLLVRRSERADEKAAPRALSVKLTRLTESPGPEGEPTISPDGTMIAFVRADGGDDDIFLQRAGGTKEINLTSDSAQDDSEPAFSPDGGRIAFRSERDGGGLFVMGATGESPVRVSTFGYFPSWSPDGSELLFSTQQVPGPRMGPDISEIWTVDVETGQTRLVLEAPSAHPVWSPSGMRIAYWGQEGGQRDIWTVRPDGTDRQAVTDDAATDWRPLWSPDGRFLYFISDRGGVDNLWRVPVDESSGLTLGSPEPVTTGTSTVGTFGLSRDGQRFAASVGTVQGSLEKLGFDPDAVSVVGQPVQILSTIAPVPDLSPDGQWIAYMSWGREDILVVRSDGTGLRRLTDDPARDRFPHWSPQGDRILFMSNRSGRYQVWTIRPDGGGLRQETDGPEDLVAPSWAPDGSRFVCTDRKGSVYLASLVTGANGPRRPEEMEMLPRFEGKDGVIFMPSAWSLRGDRIVGDLLDPGGNSAGLAIFSFESGRYTEVSKFDPPIANWTDPRWLPDGRRLVYARGMDLLLVDADTGQERRIEIPGAGADGRAHYLSSDGRVLLRLSATFDQDIWLIDLDSGRRAPE